MKVLITDLIPRDGQILKKGFLEIKPETLFFANSQNLYGKNSAINTNKHSSIKPLPCSSLQK
mgnify:CR=1 FL=1